MSRTTVEPRSDLAPDEEVEAVLAAVGDGTRRRLLERLAETGSASATTLAARLPISRQAVVQHLQVLEAAGLAGTERAGRQVLYSIHRDPLDASARWLTDLGAAWDRRLGRLKRAAEASAD